MTQNLSDTEMYFALFDMERDASGQHHAPTWPLYRSDENIRLVKERAASFKTLPSISLFIRSFNELRAEGAIKAVRQRDPMKIDDSERALTAELFFKMPAAEVRRRFAQEPEFRSQVEHLLAIGAI